MYVATTVQGRWCINVDQARVTSAARGTSSRLRKIPKPKVLLLRLLHGWSSTLVITTWSYTHDVVTKGSRIISSRQHQINKQSDN